MGAWQLNSRSLSTLVILHLLVKPAVMLHLFTPDQVIEAVSRHCVSSFKRGEIVQEHALAVLIYYASILFYVVLDLS